MRIIINVKDISLAEATGRVTSVLMMDGEENITPVTIFRRDPKDIVVEYHRLESGTHRFDVYYTGVSTF